MIIAPAPRPQHRPRLAVPGAAAEPLPRRGLVLLVLLALCWGSNWPAMKVVLAAIPVWTFRSACLLGGGIGVLGIAMAGGRSVRIPAPELAPLVLCSLLNIVCWNLLSAYGVRLMPAGRASIIAYTMPAWRAQRVRARPG